jgi:hypothetical protein
MASRKKSGKPKKSVRNKAAQKKPEEKKDAKNK